MSTTSFETAIAIANGYDGIRQTLDASATFSHGRRYERAAELVSIAIRELYQLEESLRGAAQEPADGQ